MEDVGNITVKIMADTSEFTANIEEAKEKLVELIELAERARIALEIDVGAVEEPAA